MVLIRLKKRIRFGDLSLEFKLDVPIFVEPDIRDIWEGGDNY